MLAVATNTASAIGPKVARVIESAGNIVSSGNRFVHPKIDGPDEIRRLLDEVSDLQRLLQLLSKIINENPGLAIPGLLEIIADCEIDLEKLESKTIIPSSSRSLLSALAWPLKDAETRKHMSRIEQHKSKLSIVRSEMQLLIGKDGLELSRDLQSATQRIESLLIAQESESKLSARRLDNEKERIVLRWIYPEQVDTRHRGILEKRRGTGRWLLEHPVYLEWANSEASNKILWCSAGSGKTFLTSFVIENLQRRVTRPGYGIAYVYFQFEESDRQIPTKVFSSLLKQLAMQSPPALKLLDALYEKFAAAQSRPMQQDLEDVVFAAVRCFTDIHLVFDALDECDEDKLRSLLLPLINRLAAANAYIYVTSRQNPQDIQLTLQSASRIEVIPSEEDVRAFVDQEIKNNPRARFLAQIDRENLLAKLISCAGGMFVMIRFKMDHLLQQPTKRKILNELEKLDDSLAGEKLLDKMYRRILENIERQDDAPKELAFAALTWLVHAKRSFTVSEVSIAISIKHQEYELDAENQADATALLDICGGFVVVDEESQLVRLAHSTVREYLARTVESIRRGQEIPVLCLTYLSHDCFGRGSCRSQEEFNERVSTYPFLAYAGRYLEAHIDEIGILDDKRLFDALKYFTMHIGNLETYLQVANAPESREYGFDWYPHRSCPIHVLASIGIYFPEFVQGLDYEKLSVQNHLGQNALHIASRKGRASIVKFLIEEQVDVATTDSRGYTGLCWAVWEGHLEVVKLFLNLEKQADALLMLRTNLGESVLHLAVSRQHFEIVQILASKGMDLDIQDQEKDTALHIAARKGQEIAVEALLNSKASANVKNAKGLTPCDEAKLAGFENIVNAFKELSVFPTTADLRPRSGRLLVPGKHSRSTSAGSSKETPSEPDSILVGNTPVVPDRIGDTSSQATTSAAADGSGLFTPQESVEESESEVEQLEPDIFIAAEKFKRVIELSDIDCTIEDNNEELRQICGDDFEIFGNKHWRIRLESHTNLRFLTNAIPPGSYLVLWKFAYKVDPEQGSLKPQMIMHNCSAGWPVNSNMFLSRITDPSQPYISTGLSAIINPRVTQAFHLPLAEVVPDIAFDTYGLKMKREGAEDLVDRQMITIGADEEFCFLVKRVTFSPVIKGKLMFLGVGLIHVPVVTRPTIVLR